MSGLTFGTTLSFLPWLNSDLLRAVSRRRRSLSSSFYSMLLEHLLQVVFQGADSGACTLLTYRSTCHNQFQLSSLSTDQCAEFLTHPFEQAQSIVLSQRL